MLLSGGIYEDLCINELAYKVLYVIIKTSAVVKELFFIKLF